MFALALATIPMVTRAADTVEPWDVGATDVDFYTGFDGIGLTRTDQTIYGNIMLGYGLIDHFSAYACVNLQGDGQLANGEAGLNLGIYGTPIDTAHFDLDFFLDFGGSGPGLSNFTITPSLEMNFDYAPDLQKWGIYLRAGLPVYAITSKKTVHTRLDVTTTLGTYWTIAPNHQVLLEFDTTFHPQASGQKAEIGGLALGYNVCLTKNCGIEMINQVYFDIPQAGEQFSTGIMTGMIVTLPSAK